MLRLLFPASSFLALLLIVASHAGASPRLDQIELTGVFGWDDRIRVGLIDRIDGILGWLEVGSTTDGLEVVEYFPDELAVLLRVDGKERLVRLRASETTSLKALHSQFAQRNSEADIVFDASQLIVFEEAQSRSTQSEARRRKREALRSAGPLEN